MESSVKSSSSGTSDSWLFIKNIDEDETNAGKNPESNNHLKTTEEMEDSDGISVISESEMYKNHTNSDNELEKGQIAEEIDQEGNFEAQDAAKNNQEEEEIEDPNLLTPPNTPNEFNDEEQELQANVIEKYEDKALKEADTAETAKCHKSSHGVLLLIGMSLIIAILYTNVTSLKNELARTASVYEQRILRLEEENQVLRTRLDELMGKLEEFNKIYPYNSKEKVIEPLPVPQKTQEYPIEHEIIRKPPITKDVWLGGEKEDVVKVLDKKYNSLPDYCYFTDENDLFYEYNMENCEKKKQKMEQRIRKLNDEESATDYIKKFSSDDIYKSNDHKYNEFISKTTDEIIQSFNDEIQEIKKSRFMTTSTNDDENLNKKTATKENRQKAEEQSTYEGSGNLDKKRRTQQPKIEESANRDKTQQTDNYEDLSTQDKKSKDVKKRKRNQENNSEGDKSQKKQQKRPKSTKRKDKEASGDDWIERRTMGREDARMKKENEENWYLKRKNDREIHRLTDN